MRSFRQLMSGKASNWAICLLSGSLMAMAFSIWTRPAPVSAQGNQPRRVMDKDSKAVLTALSDAFVNIADTVEPSVVTISARANQVEKAPSPMQDKGDGGMLPEPFRDFDFFRRGGPSQPRTPSPSTGSGVIIKEQGSTVWVLTNNHVVADRDKFKVQLYDKTDYTGELVGVDQRTDLAVLKFQTRRPLAPGSVAALGDSDRVKSGQWACAIGSPLGYESTLTVGVISARGRELAGLGNGSASYTDLIQTDASINPGNSGGALVNIDGEVIGINVAIASSGMSQGNIGIGFAIPINSAKTVADQLISKGKVVRGYLGVACSSANRELSEGLRDQLKVPTGGALAETVNPDTPAARGGMKDGDVITKFGPRDVHSFSDLEKAVANVTPGNAIPVEVVREGKPVRLNITVVERPSEDDLLKRAGVPDADPAPGRGNANGGGNAPQATKAKFGLSVRAGTDGKGVVIAGVTPGSPAFDAGLDSGYSIEQVQGTATPTVDAFVKALDGAAKREEIVLRVRTPVGLRFVTLRP
jgi:serine protease Do